MGNNPSSGPSMRQSSSIRTPLSKYSVIGDNYKTLAQVTAALAEAGLESSNLIVGIDFTKSNEWSGKHTFGGRSLHAIDPTGQTKNPYEQAVDIIGRTLSKFDEDNLIPCYGFGDVTTHDKDVFSFFPDGRPCNGFGEALERYRAIVPHIRLAGPTSFAPIIEMAMKITADSGGQYHILVIVADGQVTRSSDIPRGQFSPQEDATINAIVNASSYPLSIIMVGVGDGPWDDMKSFDDRLPARQFDNFQFVNHSEIMRKFQPEERDAGFALNALMEIPAQCKASAPLLGSVRGIPIDRKALPPPPTVFTASASGSAGQYGPPPGYPPGVTYYATEAPSGYPPTASQYGVTYANEEAMACPVCLTERRNVAFDCGHRVCRGCAETLQNCPLCRKHIERKILLY
eukprot:TRINITY_DN139_c0_g1_i1.p1 TRINITY_DN139_c0_g1~~TRINITY_DN139_c0_g1_i1.p1  ORF type:complete len:401 (-),score=45.08 TRINITY_DN139_c0_g1_i1:518-1720(-)